MEEENGDYSSSESDVPPILSTITSEIEELKGEKKIKLPIYKFDSPSSTPGVSAVVLPVLYHGDLAAGDVPTVEDPNVTDDKPKEKSEETTKKETSTPEKKKRIQVDANASIKDTADNVHYLSALPVIAEEPQPYIPILYTFRVKTKGKTTKLKNIITKPPPFHLQFDHTIAVIWTLFNKDANKNNLGIVQLQWALYFLKSIYNSEGVHPKDVQLCIDTIQDYLIDEYADISEESVIYGSTKFGDFVNPREQEKTLPFSLNYSQMIDKCPRSCLDTTESTIIDKQLLEELENVKKVVGIDSIDLTKVVSKDQVMNILNDWKKEQIEKIQDELKMLYVVEDMMKNSDSQNFGGYTDEKQFETIFKKNKEKSK